MELGRIFPKNHNDHLTEDRAVGDSLIRWCMGFLSSAWDGIRKLPELERARLTKRNLTPKREPLAPLVERSLSNKAVASFMPGVEATSGPGRSISSVLCAKPTRVDKESLWHLSPDCLTEVSKGPRVVLVLFCWPQKDINKLDRMPMTKSCSLFLLRAQSDPIPGFGREKDFIPISAAKEK